MILKLNSNKSKRLFPENLFGKSDVDKDINKRKRVLEKAKEEIEQKKNYKPELTFHEKIELGKYQEAKYSLSNERY